MMLTENLEYLAPHLRCTAAEKDACLETVAAVLHQWEAVRRDGALALGFSPESQALDPFFRACLRDTGDLWGAENEARLRDLFLQYLAAGDYRGADFLRGVVIAEGLLLLARLGDDMPGFRKWGEELSLAVRGYFGAEYREKVEKTILREIWKYEKAARKVSFLTAFDALAELSPELCVRLWQELSGDPAERRMAVALKYAGEAARDRVLSVLSPEEQERLEDEMERCTFLREKDVREAQEEILKRAAALQA